MKFRNSKSNFMDLGDESASRSKLTREKRLQV